MPDLVELENVAFEGFMVRRASSTRSACPTRGYFIFYDDVDYALRARRAGFRIWAVRDAVLVRQLDFDQQHDLSGWKGYYMYRNLFTVHRRYGENRLVRAKPWLIAAGVVALSPMRGGQDEVRNVSRALRDAADRAVTPEPVTREAPPLRGRVISTQAWRDLTFVHWARRPGCGRAVHACRRPARRPRGPHVRRPRAVPDGRRRPGRGSWLPYFGTFLETNVRLYSVDETGRRGVVFLSLDTDRAAAVPAIRASIGAPYRWARMRFRREGDVVTYDARLRRLGRPAREPGRGPGGCGARGDPARRLPDRPLGRPRGTTPRHDVRAEPARALDAPRRRGPRARGRARRLGRPPGLADRPPDHVAFSDGVHAEFGRPRRL